MNMVSVLFGPRNITFGNILTQKYRTYLPICTCAEWPPGVITIYFFAFQALQKGDFKVLGERSES